MFSCILAVIVIVAGPFERASAGVANAAANSAEAIVAVAARLAIER